MTEIQPVDSAGTPGYNLLYAVFNDEAAATQAERSLHVAGVQIERLQGEEAAQSLRGPDAQGGSVIDKVERFVKGIGGEDLEAQRYAIHAEHGRVVLVIPAENRDAAVSLTAQLTAHGAYDITYFSQWMIEHMTPGENAAHGLPTYESSTSPVELTTGQVPPQQPNQ